MLSIIVTNMNLTAPMTRPTICRLIALLAAGFVSAAQAQSADPIRISPDQLAKSHRDCQCASRRRRASGACQQPRARQGHAGAGAAA